jgi:branched-chain amino acid transport system ATP-binding protein
MLLKVDHLAVFYDDVQALWDVSFEVREKEIAVILGSNGAGKTTTLKTISGVLRAKSGEVIYNGSRIDRWSPTQIVEAGIAHVPEGRKLFPQMSVRENLEMGSISKRSKPYRADSLEMVLTLFPRLKERINQAAGTMSGGEQQMVAISRGLMAKPQVLILDEPSLGLAPIIVQQMFQAIKQVNETGVTVLIVEQNVQQSLKIAHRGYVIENGRMVLSGEADRLLNDPQVREAYLGSH